MLKRYVITLTGSKVPRMRMFCQEMAFLALSVTNWRQSEDDRQGLQKTVATFYTGLVEWDVCLLFIDDAYYNHLGIKRATHIE